MRWLLPVVLLLGGCNKLLDIETVSITADAFVPVDSPAPTAGVVQISAGGRNTCARAAGGSVLCWGVGAGATSATDILTPRAILASEVTDVAVGDAGVCAVLADGTGRCWGTNELGALGIGTTGPQLMPTQPMTGSGNASGLVRYSIGNGVACVLRTDHTVACAGKAGLLGDGSTIDRTVLGPVRAIADATAIAVGDNHACAVRTEGQLWCWGDNSAGQLGGPPSASATLPVLAGIGPYISVAAGDAHTCALGLDGRVTCWGANNRGQCGLGTTSATSLPTATDVTSVVSIAAGAFTTYAVHADGTVSAWGDNSVGQLGDGTQQSRPKPEDIGLSNIYELTSGTGEHACALDDTGRVLCWGANDYGQLGTGNTSGSTTPLAVAGLPSRS